MGIDGKERVKGVTGAKVDADRKPSPGTEEYIPCDTLLLSVGLIPENELSNKLGVAMAPVTNGPKVNESLETSIPGVFACGDCTGKPYQLAKAAGEGNIAALSACEYVKENK